MPVLELVVWFAALVVVEGGKKSRGFTLLAPRKFVFLAAAAAAVVVVVVAVVDGDGDDVGPRIANGSIGLELGLGFTKLFMLLMLFILLLLLLILLLLLLAGRRKKSIGLTSFELLIEDGKGAAGGAAFIAVSAATDENGSSTALDLTDLEDMVMVGEIFVVVETEGCDEKKSIGLGLFEAAAVEEVEDVTTAGFEVCADAPVVVLTGDIEKSSKGLTIG